MAFKWTSEYITKLIIAIEREVEKSGRVCDGTGFKSTQWNSIREQFCLSTEIEQLDKQKLMSQWSVLKRKYSVWKWLGGQSGWNVSEDGLIIGPDCGWENLKEIHKDDKQKCDLIKFFQKNSLENHIKLQDLLEGRAATGKYSRSSTEETKDFLDSSDTNEDEEVQSNVSGEINERVQTPAVAPITPGTSNNSTISTKTHGSSSKKRAAPVSTGQALVRCMGSIANMLNKSAESQTDKARFRQLINNDLNFVDKFSLAERFTICKNIDEDAAGFVLSLKSFDSQCEILENYM